MRPTINEGHQFQNNFLLPIQCLIQDNAIPHETWDKMRLHYHEYIEILYSLEGEFEIMLNGEIHALHKQSMVVINAGESHCIKSTKADGQLLLCIKFLPQVLYSSEQTITEMEYSIPYVFESFGSKRLFEKKLLNTSFIPKEMDYIYSEKQIELFGHELAICSSILRIFSWLIRYWHDNSDSQIPSLNTATLKTIHLIKEYIEQNYVDATLLATSRACGLSYGYFSRFFNKYMKMSFSEYINVIRVNHSLKLLASTDMSITEIALTVGFSTTSYYIQTFKKYKNISPKQFRKMFKGYSDES